MPSAASKVVSKVLSSTQSLDRYDARHAPPSEQLGTPISMPPPQSESTHVFAILHKVGYVTSLGCVCCIPVRVEKDQIHLRVCTQRLVCAARALGESISKCQLRAFMRNCSNDKECPSMVSIDCKTLNHQWKSMSTLDDTTIEHRAKFAARLKASIHKKNWKPLISGENSPDIASDFGFPYAKEWIDEKLLSEFLVATSLGPYRPGAHYGLFWKSGPHRRTSYATSVLDAQCGCHPSTMSFIHNLKIPGPMRVLNTDEESGAALEKIISRRLVAADEERLPLSVLLEKIPYDGRMLRLNLRRADEMATSQERDYQ